MRNSASDVREGRARGEMRLHASGKGFCDRAVEIVYQFLLCDLGSLLEARGLDSPHQVEAEVGLVINPCYQAATRPRSARIR